LSDSDEKRRAADNAATGAEHVHAQTEAPASVDIEPVSGQAVKVEKNRLFQTVEKTKGSSRKYLIVLGVVAVFVIAAGVTASYLTLPGVGDKVLAPRGLDQSMREHFLTKQKRDMTVNTVYQCEGFFWTRVGVETRNDLPNPVFRIGTYAARATPNGDGWDITAAPITSPEMDVPCS